MNSIDPNVFGCIRQISATFAAYSNWPDTKIIPFSKEDILKAVNEQRFEKRSFQDPSTTDDLNKLFEELNRQNTPKHEKDQILSNWARNFHIERVAFLYSNFPADPIVLSSENQVVDGLHRILAAIALGRQKVDCKYIS